MTYDIRVLRVTLLIRNSLHSHHRKKDSLSIDNIPQLQPKSFCSGALATRELGAEYVWWPQHRGAGGGKHWRTFISPRCWFLRKNLRQSGKIPSVKCELSRHHLKKLKFLYSSSSCGLMKGDEILPFACDREQKIFEIC